MSLQKDNGQWGEDLAISFLVKNGFEILHRNWRYKRAEVDIIARDEGILVFIEVKARSYTYFGRPEEMVGIGKKRMLFAAAAAFMASSDYEREIRFDIISIVGQPGHVIEMLHFKDAFYPGMSQV